MSKQVFARTWHAEFSQAIIQTLKVEFYRKTLNETSSHDMILPLFCGNPVKGVLISQHNPTLSLDTSQTFATILFH
jgi:hypothetical protein